MEERPCCRRKGSCLLFALAGRRLCSCGGQVAQLPILLLVSMVTWIVAMLTFLLWRKAISSVIFPLIPFAFHCISRRQFVCVGVESGPGFISISPAHRSISWSISANIGRSATKKAIRRVEKVRKLWLSGVSVCDPAAKRQHPFGPSRG